MSGLLPPNEEKWELLNSGCQPYNESHSTEGRAGAETGSGAAIAWPELVYSMKLASLQRRKTIFPPLMALIVFSKHQQEFLTTLFSQVLGI